MAVVSVNELYPRKATIDQTWRRHYTRVFRVITDTPDDGPSTVRAGLGIQIGQFYNVNANEQDAFAFVRNIDLECTDEDGKGWTVTVEYGPYDVLLFSENPLDNRIELQWSWAQSEEIVDQDINGNAIVNTAGDYFDPPVTRDQSRPVLTIARNEQTYDPLVAAQYKDHVNSGPWYGWQPKMVKCSNISAEQLYHPAVGIYYRVNYEFQFEPNTWTKEILNQGMRQLVSGAQQQILVKGLPISSPALLDQNGAVLAPNATPIFLQFEVYNEVDFSGLNLGG